MPLHNRHVLYYTPPVVAFAHKGSQLIAVKWPNSMFSWVRICFGKGRASDTVGFAVHAFPLSTDPSTHSVYVTTSPDNAVVVIDGTSHAVTATVPFRVKPYDVSVDPGTHVVYVTHTDDGIVSIIENGP